MIRRSGWLTRCSRPPDTVRWSCISTRAWQAHPPEAIAAAKDTATNPDVVDAFALAIVADGQGPAYPGIPNHEPNTVAGRKAANDVHRCMSELRAISPNTGSYVSESNYFQQHWQHAYWGTNYDRLRQVKKKYDPSGLFVVHNGVGSEG